MPDYFLQDEASIEASEPREFYEIVQSAAVTYYIASGERDVVYGGNTYVANPVARTGVGIVTSSGNFALTLRLPLSHPLAQRYLAASPPMRVQVTVYRKQLNSGVVEQIWVGFVTSLSANLTEHVVDFQIPSRLSRAIQRQTPSLVASTTCGHVLYDGNCRADPAPFTVDTTVVSVDGRTVVVASVSTFGPEVFEFGSIQHVLTGELQTIFDQIGTTIQMQEPVPDIKVGDAVILLAGCAHDIDTCHTKFNNQVNFGGQPQLPNANLWLPGNGSGGIWIGAL